MMEVVFLGLGVVTPLGQDRETNWQRLLQSAPIESVPLPSGLVVPETSVPLPAVSASETTTAEERGGLQLPGEWFIENSPLTRLEQLALQTAQAALADADLLDSDWLRSPRMGLVVGTSKGPLEHYHPPRCSPPGSAFSNLARWNFDQLWPSGPSSCLIREYGMTGPALCPVSACATGLDAVLRGVRLIQQGDCDVVLAGSVDASVNQYLKNSYQRLGVLADRHLPLEQACQPFDVNRSGFVIGEGGAMFLLARSDWSGIQNRKAYARWLHGESCADSTSLTQLDPQGISLSRLLGNLVIQARRQTRQIDLLQLHGTGTRANDTAESRAIRAVFGPAEQQPWSTASKGAHGHALGAAGSIELAWLLLSLRDGLIPPVKNLTHPDPVCPIRPVMNTVIRQPLKTGLKISLGFGGHQIACLLERGNRKPVA